MHEKGGKQYSMPCNHALAEALRANIDAIANAEDRKGSPPATEHLLRPV